LRLAIASALLGRGAQNADGRLVVVAHIAHAPTPVSFSSSQTRAIVAWASFYIR
jgi:hypothetical protein